MSTAESSRCRIRSVICAFVFAAVIAAASARAEDLHIEPGLWEMTYRYSVQGEPPPSVLEKLTPEKRAEVEQAWAKRVGQTKTNTAAICATAEEIAQGTAFENEATPAPGCERTIGTRTASRLTLVERCMNASGRAERNVQINVRGPHEIEGAMNAVRGSGDAASGLEMTFHGKWLAKGCGDVR